MSTRPTPVPAPRPGVLRTVGEIARGLLPIGLGLFALLVLLVAFAVPGPMISTSSTIGAEIAFSRVAGRDVVVLAYQAGGYAGFNSGLDDRITAIDLATGEALWDEALPDTGVGADVIAAGRTYAYVRYADGLAIVALADGSVVADGDEIDGLGADGYDGFRVDTAYLYDHARELIVLRTESGEVRTIGLDRTTAVPADAETVATWSCVLTDGDARPVPVSYDTTADTLDLPDGRTFALRRPESLPAGLPLTRLHAVEDGATTELSATEYANAAFPQEFVPVEPRRRACPDLGPTEDVFPRDQLTAPRPIALASGITVIESTTDVNTEDRQLTVVDLDTGRSTATVPTGHGFLRALTAPSGQLVVTARVMPDGPLHFSVTTPTTDVLTIVDERGGVREVLVGERGWFGEIGA